MIVVADCVGIKVVKSKAKAREDLAEAFVGLSVLLGVWVWLNTENPSLGIVAFSSAITLIIGYMLVRKIRAKRQLIESGINIVDRMTGEQFEEFLLAHFQDLGYKGYLTPTREDYGADVVLEKDGCRIVVQAKAGNSRLASLRFSKLSLP